MTTAPDPYQRPTAPGTAIPGTAVEPHLPGEAGVVDAPPPVPLLTRVGAEVFGTFALVLTILGSALYARLTEVGTLGVAIATALVLAGLIAGFGHVSGGHFNPAVSLGAALAGRVSFLDMLAYWLAQVVGALLAALVLLVAIPKGLAAAISGNPDASSGDFFTSVANGWGELSPLGSVSGGQYVFDLRTALILEAVGTAIFVAVILGVTGRKAAVVSAPFAIGGTLGAMIIVTGLVTNAGLNPARSTAAAIFAGGDAVGQLWLFWVAPLLGAAIVGLIVMAFAPPAEAAYVPEAFDDELDDDELDDELDEDDIDDDEPGEDVVVKPS